MTRSYIIKLGAKKPRLRPGLSHGYRITERVGQIEHTCVLKTRHQSYKTFGLCDSPVFSTVHPRGAPPEATIDGDKDVKICGGVSTVRQYLQAGLVDSIHLAQSPVLLGEGEALFAGLNLRALGFQVTHHEASKYARHILLEKP